MDCFFIRRFPDLDDEILHFIHDRRSREYSPLYYPRAYRPVSRLAGIEAIVHKVNSALEGKNMINGEKYP